MASRSLTDLMPAVRVLAQQLLSRAQERGFTLLVTSTLRTAEEQDELYAQGRTAPGSIVTNAKAWQSWHNYGRAFDVCFQSPQKTVTWLGPWDLIGSIGEAVGLEWGGRWRNPDRPHFQFTEGLTLAQAKARLDKGEA